MICLRPNWPSNTTCIFKPTSGAFGERWKEAVPMIQFTRQVAKASAIPDANAITNLNAVAKVGRLSIPALAIVLRRYVKQVTQKKGGPPAGASGPSRQSSWEELGPMIVEIYDCKLASS